MFHVEHWIKSMDANKEMFHVEHFFFLVFCCT